jgi:DNA-binding Lrp family transcriptional regulator
MTRSTTHVDPPAIHPDAYPVTRVSTEFHLRGFDLLTAVHGDLISGVIVMTLVRHQMGALRREAISFRELSRKLDMPAETVRRHILNLVRSSHCVVKDGGVAVSPAALRGRPVTTFLRKIYVNAVRLLADLTRVEVVAFAPSSRRPVTSGRLSREQTRIAIAATGLLLAGVRATRGYWGGDVMNGLVYTAISAANVKHVTNSASAAIRAVLPDSERKPVSVLAISRSLRLPYETTRRHAEALLKAGVCVRVGRHGLLVPARFIHGATEGSVLVYCLVKDFVAELRRAGVKV